MQRSDEKTSHDLRELFENFKILQRASGQGGCKPTAVACVASAWKYSGVSSSGKPPRRKPFNI